NFWNTFFKAFPEVIKYIDGVNDIKINNLEIARNSENGGSLLLRPVGQELIAGAYLKFQDEDKSIFINKLKKIDFNLSGDIWKYIFWNEKMLGKNLKLKNEL